MDREIEDISRRIRLLTMNPDAVSKRAGIARSTLRRWLSGATLPTLAVLRKVQGALDEIEQERVDG